MFLPIGLFLGIAAFALLAGAVWAYFKQKGQMESRAPAEGTVIELVARAGRRGSIYCPVVEFGMPSGQRVRFTSEFGSRPAGYQVGQRVKVRYDPADLQKAEIESGLTLWLAPLILVFMGAIACCLAVLFLGVYMFANPSFVP